MRAREMVRVSHGQCVRVGSRVTRRPDFGRTVRFSNLLSGPLLRVRLFALLSSFSTLPAHRRNLKLALASGSANFSVGFQMPKRKTSFNHTCAELPFVSKSSKDQFHAFCKLCHIDVSSKGKWGKGTKITLVLPGTLR